MDKVHKHNSINMNTPLSKSYRSDVVKESNILKLVILISCRSEIWSFTLTL
jgi:hypothetical protein